MDLIGQRFGRLEVIGLSHKDCYNHFHWKCLCDCGNESIIRDNSLKGGYTQSCGCFRNQIVSETQRGKKRFIDLTGQIFGKLTIISYAYTKNGIARWNCICSCGTEKIIDGRSLKSGSTISCGCHRILEASKPKTIAHRFKLSKPRSMEFRIKLSEACKGKRIGENNPNWKGGIPKTVYGAKRRCIKLNNTLTLTNYEDNKIKMYYKICSYLGNKYQVDHIIPLSKDGKHHPDNLWIIPTVDNLKKHNKLDYELKHNFYFKL